MSEYEGWDERVSVEGAFIPADHVDLINLLKSRALADPDEEQEYTDLTIQP